MSESECECETNQKDWKTTRQTSKLGSPQPQVAEKAKLIHTLFSFLYEWIVSNKSLSLSFGFVLVSLSLSRCRIENHRLLRLVLDLVVSLLISSVCLSLCWARVLPASLRLTRPHGGLGPSCHVANHYLNYLYMHCTHLYLFTRPKGFFFFFSFDEKVYVNKTSNFAKDER